MITNFTWTQTPIGYLRQREITIHVSYQLSDIIAKMQWCSVTLNSDLISRLDLCNVISLDSPYLRVFSPCSFKSEVTDCIMRKTAKRSQLLEVKFRKHWRDWQVLHQTFTLNMNCCSDYVLTPISKESFLNSYSYPNSIYF